MLFKLVVGKSIVTVLSTYVPQNCLDNSVNKRSVLWKSTIDTNQN